MLATFGYPDLVEAAAGRAIEAAFDLTAAMSRLSFDMLPVEFRPLAVHSGVHAGLVLVVGGDIERGRFDLVGDVPNSAERLSKAAGPGEVCVSVGTIGPGRSDYVVGESLAVTIAPGEPKLPTYRLTARKPVEPSFATRHRAGPSRFVGRESALQALCDFVADAGSGMPRCATISGGPGLGKSRLIAELLGKPDWNDVAQVRGYCDGHLVGETLQPFKQILRATSVVREGAVTVPGLPNGDALDLDPAHHAALCQALAGDQTASAMAAALVPAMAAFVGGIARRRRTVLVLDDWQWADDASRQVLAAVLALTAPLSVVVASRERDVSRLATLRAPRLDLEPLAPQASGDTVADLLPGADPFLVREIHRQAGGVPLYVEELCHAARAGRAIDALPERAGSTAWLDLLVESRLGRLPLEVADAVRLCAVLGAVFPRWLMEEVVGFSVDAPAFVQAAQADFLWVRVDSAVQFKHQLTRDAVYGTIGRQRRRDWHARVFTLLRDRAGEGDADSVEALAFHAAGAGRLRDQAQFAEQAGDKAMAVFALDRARSHFLSALKAMDPQADAEVGDPAGWCRVVAKLGMAAVFDPLALSDGLSLFERAVALAGTLSDADALARAEYWLGYVCYARGATRRAVLHCGRAAVLAQRIGDRRLLTQIEATLGQVLFSAGRYDDALLRLDAALDGKRQQARPGSGVAIGSAYTLACKGALLGDRGQFEQAHACFAQALGLLGDSGHPVGSSVRGWIATVYLWQGDWREASRVAREGELIADRSGTRHLLAMSRAMDGYACWRLGEGVTAYDRVRESTAWIEQRQGAFTASLNYGWLLEMAVELGQGEDVVRPMAARLLARARQGDRLGEAMGRRALARLAWKQGRAAAAERMLCRAERCATLRGAAHEESANDICRAQLGQRLWRL